jgi:asparaginyl-tRNA synthetase
MSLAEENAALRAELEVLKAAKEAADYRIQHLVRSLKRAKAAGTDSGATAGPASGADLSKVLTFPHVKTHPKFHGTELDFPLGDLSGKRAIGSAVTIAGWTQVVRSGGGGDVLFFDLADGTGSGNVQCVMGKDGEGLDRPGLAAKGYVTEVADVSRDLVRGTALLVQGLLVQAPARAQHTVEVRVAAVKILGGIADRDKNPIPDPKAKAKIETLRQNAVFRPRVAPLAAVARIRAALAEATHAFFSGNDFQLWHSPILSASDCEGAGELFAVSAKKESGADFFETPTYLTVSGQLHAEAGALALGRVYTFGPTFRAEDSNTARHLCEFWMIEPEMSFCDKFAAMDIAEAYVKYTIGYCLQRNDSDLEVLEVGKRPFQNMAPGLRERLTKVVTADFARVSYREALQILRDSKVKFTTTNEAGEAVPASLDFGIDMSTEMEKWLAGEHFGRPVFVYDYPAAIKAFYMRRNDDGDTVGAFDLLVPGVGELVGGSQREERREILEPLMREHGLLETLDWYLELREYGSVPHSGFGLGFERLVMLVTAMTNIRDVIPFPRSVGSIAY